MGLKSKVKGAAGKVKGAIDEKRYAKQVTAAKKVIADWEKIIEDGHSEMTRVEKNAGTLEPKIDAILKIVSRGSLPQGDADKLSTEIKVLQNAIASNGDEAEKIAADVGKRALASTRNPGKAMIAAGVISGKTDPAEPTVTKITMKTIKPLGYRISDLQKREKLMGLRIKTAGKKIDTAAGLLGNSAQKTDKLVAMVTAQVKKLVEFAKAAERNMKPPEAKRGFIERLMQQKTIDPKVVRMLQHQYDEFVNAIRESEEAVARIGTELDRIRGQIPREVATDARVATMMSSTEAALNKISAVLAQRGKDAATLRADMKASSHFRAIGLKMA